MNAARESRYSAIAGPGLLNNLGRELRALSPAKKACLITDQTVGRIYGARAAESLASAGFDVITAILDGGETNKRLEKLAPIYETLLAARVERATPVVALGGGIVGDVAGFVAGTMLRGMPWAAVPTTLLAMVDASIGGKTGVNAAAGKNLIGVFHPPIMVRADVDVLATLPDAEMSSGLAECIKHCAIADAAALADLETQLPRIMARDAAVLTELVTRHVAIKRRIVDADPLETGERAKLNFGHTFGHAIETTSNHAISHGAAVGLGMTAAMRLSRDLGMLGAADVARLHRVIADAGLATRWPDLPTAAVLDAMRGDKKIRDGKLRLVLLRGIGDAVVRDDVPADAVERALAGLRDGDGD